jgi:alpha-D-ribose 1-methylphosphonate 5-triphosphate synthase subunit PhnL
VAESVVVSPRQESRRAAYEHAGRMMLAKSDVLLALWDGQPSGGQGGTAQMVTEARELAIPVDIIHVERASDAPTPA